MKKLLTGIGCAIVLLSGGVLALVLLVVVVVGQTLNQLNPFADRQDWAISCVAGSGVAATATAALPQQVGSWSGEQIENAAAIIDTGHELGVPLQAQAIAVMTAMGESSLRNISYGDWETSRVTNPDGTPTSSIGLFQQQRWWGSVAERMDPAASSRLFYEALLAVDGWETMEPTLAAHKTQNNSEWDYYADFWPDAVQILEALSDIPEGSFEETPMIAPAGSVAPCSGTSAGGAATADGWTNPALGSLTSRFGQRVHPVTGAVSFHAGDDVAASCGTPVWAAADGIVLRAAPGPYQGRTGNQIVIDHGGGVITRYGHVLTGTMGVRAGDTVGAGQQIAAVGGDPGLDPVGAGSSTGCHLHFEVNIDGEPVSPSDFLSSHGVTLGANA